MHLDKKIFPRMFFECDKLTEILNISETVTSIREFAFYGCSTLTKIIIPSSVTSIEKSAFEECIFLSDIQIPSSVSFIGRYCFFECHSLTRIEIPSSVTMLDDSTFRECSNLIQISLPVNLAKIGIHCFEGCVSLKEISIPSSVTEIGCFAFKDCSSLDEVVIPNSVAIIEPYTFANCTSLKKITIPNSVVSIKDYSFNHCSSLDEVSIPKSVKFIGEYSFGLCHSLKNITISSSSIEIEDKAFEKKHSSNFSANVSFVRKIWNYATCIYKSIFQSSESTPSSMNENKPNINHPIKSKYKTKMTENMKAYSYKENVYYIVETKTNKKFIKKAYTNLSLFHYNDGIKKLTDNKLKFHINANHPTFVKFYGYSFNNYHNKCLEINMENMENDSLYNFLIHVCNGLMPHQFNNTKSQIILIGVARAMKYLHDCDICCLKLNTTNVFLDEDFNPKINCSIYNELSNLHDFFNDINDEEIVFLSPETLIDGTVTKKSNVYSFGILMYEVICQRRPFENTYMLFSKIVEYDLRPEFYFPIKESIRSLIEQCWSSNPDERPSFKEIFNKLAYDENYYIDDVDTEEIYNYIDGITDE